MPKETIEDPEERDPEAIMEEADDEDESAFPAERPACPHCGWSNTRLSHTHTLLDTALQAIGIRAFRCRSCNNRFRVRYRRTE